MPPPRLLHLTDCVVDLDKRTLTRGDETSPLSELEAGLLSRLAAELGQPVSRDALLVEVWGFPRPIATRAVDQTV